MSIFAKLDNAEAGRIPTLFLSYAWADASRVDKLHQLLRDHGVEVIRYTTSFECGLTDKGQHLEIRALFGQGDCGLLGKLEEPRLADV